MKINPAKRTETVQEYYFSRKLKEIAEIKSRGINVINLGIGSPDTPPSASTIEKLIESSKNPKNHGYQSYNGIPELRNGLADWYKKYFNVELNPKNEILPLMGSKEGIMHISMAFINEGDEVLVPNPGYPTYQSVSNLVGAKIRYYKLKEENNWLPDIEELEKENLDNVKLMWVNYPNMPTGAGSTKELFQNLVDFGLRNNILICNDNPYSFILNDSQLSILEAKGAKEIALELNSLSKSHSMAGWRIGMVAGNEEYINTILKVKSNMDSGMFLPLQQAAVEALKNPEQWFNQNNEVYGERREIVFEILDLLKCKYIRDQTGLFVWAKISDEFENGEKLSDYILKIANVFITPGSVFGSNGDSYIRISLST
ncbi:MAG TPA: aminotransferase, partial [Rikenellaceae bacterium]|nr:aminotransferase [Rikenellaceae bacterium]